MQEFLNQLYKTTWLELVAMITGLLFPLLAAYEKQISWLFGGVSALIYVWILMDGKLYQDAVLSIFYAGMSVYGYLMWKGIIKSKKKTVQISKADPFTFFICLVLGSQYFFLGGYCFDHFTNADYPYVDAFVTGFSLVATWLEAKKKIENWYIFLLADGVGVWLFWQKGYVLTAILYLVYCFLCIYGIIIWRRKIKSLASP
jgi:nicotinamide mononucleotide transporter